MVVNENIGCHFHEMLKKVSQMHALYTTYHPPKTQTPPNIYLESIRDTFQNHESVQRSKLESFHSKSSLKFNSVSELDVKKEILDLSSKKANIKGDIPAKILNNSISAYLSELIIFINNCLKNGVFPDDLKLVDITPIFKKEDSLNKKTIYLSAY